MSGVTGAVIGHRRSSSLGLPSFNEAKGLEKDTKTEGVAQATIKGAQLTAANSTLRQENEAAAEISRLQGELEALREQVEKLRGAAEEAEAKNTELTEGKAGVDKELAGAKERIEALTSTVSDLESKNKAQGDVLAEQTMARGEAERKLEAAEEVHAISPKEIPAELGSAREALNAAKEELEGLNKDTEKNKEAIPAQQQKVAEIGVRIDWLVTLEKTYKAVRGEAREESQADVRTLQGKLQAAKSRFDSTKAMLQIGSDKIADSIETKRAELGAAELRLGTLKSVDEAEQDKEAIAIQAALCDDLKVDIDILDSLQTAYKKVSEDALLAAFEKVGEVGGETFTDKEKSFEERVCALKTTEINAKVVFRRLQGLEGQDLFKAVESLENGYIAHIALMKTAPDKVAGVLAECQDAQRKAQEALSALPKLGQEGHDPIAYAKAARTFNMETQKVEDLEALQQAYQSCSAGHDAKVRRLEMEKTVLGTVKRLVSGFLKMLLSLPGGVLHAISTAGSILVRRG